MGACESIQRSMNVKTAGMLAALLLLPSVGLAAPIAQAEGAGALTAVGQSCGVKANDAPEDAEIEFAGLVLRTDPDGLLSCGVDDEGVLSCSTLGSSFSLVARAASTESDIEANSDKTSEEGYLDTIVFNNQSTTVTVDFYTNEASDVVNAFVLVKSAADDTVLSTLEGRFEVEGFEEALPVFCDLCSSIKPNPSSAKDASNRSGLLSSLATAKDTLAEAEHVASLISEDELLAAYPLGAADNWVAPAVAWVPTIGYERTGAVVDSVDSYEVGGVPCVQASVTVSYENGSVRVEESYSISYRKDSGDWVETSRTLTGGKITPITGISDEELVNGIASLLSKVDENPKTRGDGKNVYLKDLYEQGTSFTVLENATGPEGGTVRVQINATAGIGRYSGVLTATYAWDGRSWTVTDCSVNDEAYELSYAHMVGEHVGTWVEVQHHGGTKSCFGGASNPLCLHITAYDSVTKTLTADIAVLVHGHGRLDNASNQTEGDYIYLIQGVLIPIHDNDRYQIYKEKEADGKPFTIYIKFETDKNSNYLRVFCETMEASYTPDVSFTDVYEIDFS